MNKRRGRPAGGSSGARARLLDAAQELFVERGYDRTTVRVIAEAAGCDSALISYHFGSKAGLYARVMTLTLDPATVLAAALPGTTEDVGPRLVAHVLHVWEQPEIGQPLTRLVTTAMTDPQVMEAFRGYLDKELMSRIVEYLHGPHATDRANALMTLIVGTIFARFVVQIPTIAEQPAQDYLAALAPSARTATRRGYHVPPAGPAGHSRPSHGR